jgi:hypothetical protein
MRPKLLICVAGRTLHLGEPLAGEKDRAALAPARNLDIPSPWPVDGASAVIEQFALYHGS